MDWPSFEDFKNETFKIVRTQFVCNWKDSDCDCTYFFKNYKCKHVLGLAIRFKMVDPPEAAKNVPLGEKRKRGRPAKVGRALSQN